MSERPDAASGRLLAAYRKEGAAALAHGNRGRVPSNATPTATGQQVVAMAQERYSGINHTHLAEREGVVLTSSTVRRLLVGAGLPSPRYRRPPRHRYRRQSFRGRTPRGHAAPTGREPPRLAGGPGTRAYLTAGGGRSAGGGQFPTDSSIEQEDTQGYFLLLRGIIERHGIPLAFRRRRTDRHAVFQHWRHGTEDISASLGTGKPTQCGRALREMGVTQISAHSPEAKGRVERANGAFQDRLVSELRLAGARTLVDAQQVLAHFLPRFNPDVSGLRRPGGAAGQRISFVR